MAALGVTSLASVRAQSRLFRMLDSVFRVRLKLGADPSLIVPCRPIVDLLSEILKEGPSERVVFRVLIGCELHHDRKGCCGLLAVDIKEISIAVSQEMPKFVRESALRRLSDDHFHKGSAQSEIGSRKLITNVGKLKLPKLAADNCKC